MPLKVAGHKVFVATMNTFLSDSYDALEETLAHMNSLKINSCPGDIITDFCTVNLEDADHFEISGAFETERLGYITQMFEDNYDSILCLLAIHKYKEVAYFIKKLRVCDMYVIKPEELITYEFLVQEATC